MDPADQAQPPVGGIEPDHLRVEAIQAHRPCEERLSEGGVVGIGGGDDEEERQAGTATQQGVDAEARRKAVGWWAGACPQAASGSLRRHARTGALR